MRPRGLNKFTSTVCDSSPHHKTRARQAALQVSLTSAAVELCGRWLTAPGNSEACFHFPLGTSTSKEDFNSSRGDRWKTSRRSSFWGAAPGAVGHMVSDEGGAMRRLKDERLKSGRIAMQLVQFKMILCGWSHLWCQVFLSFFRILLTFPEHYS